MTKMLLFKPELGTLTRFNYPEDGRLVDLLDDRFLDTHRVVIDDVTYKFHTGSVKPRLDTKRHWSFYQISNDHCLYGNIVIQGLDTEDKPRDITAEDILNIKSHIVVNPKGYMIYLQ